MTYGQAAAALTCAMVISACAPVSSGQPKQRAEHEATTQVNAGMIQAAAIPLNGTASDYSALIEKAGNSNRVLLGEATHGTSEFYVERSRLTLRLIREGRFNALAIEGEWSPTYRANLYVRGMGNDPSAVEALGGFTGFPRWMWRNKEFAAFLEELRAHNLALPERQRVGIYGADVYDLFKAAAAAVSHAASLDPVRARRIRQSYRCFDRYDADLHRYGQAAQTAASSCRQQAEAALSQARELPAGASDQAKELRFAAIRSAASVVAAEEYFRTLYSGEDAWNVRDQRMSETVEAIAEHAARATGREGRVVAWAHNSHVGDARATAAAARGEHNIGQLTKQRHDGRTLLVGFFTHSGQVRAAPAWGERDRVFTLKPALPESHSGLFQRTNLPRFLLMLRDNPKLERGLSTPMLQRAVGVIYVPEQELRSHYAAARLSQQFDAAIFVRTTEAVQPL
jgi:erythromycin esterase-like protein